VGRLPGISKRRIYRVSKTLGEAAVHMLRGDSVGTDRKGLLFRGAARSAAVPVTASGLLF